jgi:hypothetical protein
MHETLDFCNRLRTVRQPGLEMLSHDEVYQALAAKRSVQSWNSSIEIQPVAVRSHLLGSSLTGKQLLIAARNLFQKAETPSQCIRA